jgi:DNA-binding NarL/FixJ family response regulator
MEKRYMERPNTILIVENEAQVRAATRLRLETRGYRVFAAETASEARQILENERVYLVIIDVRLQDDTDPSDVSGLDLAAELGPEVPKIILTGFQTPELTRRALIGYLKQVAPAQDVIAKQEGPRKLLEAVERVFNNEVYDQINFPLQIRYDRGLTLQALMAPLLEGSTALNDLEEVEVEELFRRLFQRETQIELYYIPPGRGGTSVALVKPIYYRGMEGSPIVVKFGPVEHINREISAYRNYVEPFVFRYSTVLIGQPVRTHRLAGCKLLFVGCSVDKPRDFNTFYRDRNVSDEKLQHVIRNIFAQSCGIWYKGRRGWDAFDGSLCQAMEQQLSLDLTSDHSELKATLNSLLDGKSFHHVALGGTGPQRLCVQVDGTEKELPNPLFVLPQLRDRLPMPTFAAITHGDLNGSNLFVDEKGSVWLIDFYRTGWGPALRDAAELESAIKFELIHSTNLPALLAFEAALLTPATFSERLTLPRHASDKAFQRALVAIQTVREAAWEIADRECMDEYYALLLYYALKMMTWKGISSIDRRRQPIRQRHALYSAALLSAKFVVQDRLKKQEVHIL